jgi:anti-anti-sigma factor
MTINIQHTQSELCVSGSVDLHSSPLLLKALQQKNAVFRLNLACITMLDNSGVATLIEWLRIAQQQGTTMTILNTPDCVRNAWQLAGVEELFQV